MKGISRKEKEKEKTTAGSLRLQEIIIKLVSFPSSYPVFTFISSSLQLFCLVLSFPAVA
jgi:hypothetical protein